MHLETNLLWVQDVAAGKKIEYEKHTGTDNPANMCMKYVARELSENHCRYINCDFSIKNRIAMA